MVCYAPWQVAGNQSPRVVDALVAHGKARTALFFALLLSLLANLALIVVTGLGLYAVIPDSFSMRLALVAPIGHLVNSLPLTPGGIGVGETAFNALFWLAGMDGGGEPYFLCSPMEFPCRINGPIPLRSGPVVHPFAEDLAEAESGYIGAESSD